MPRLVLRVCRTNESSTLGRSPRCAQLPISDHRFGQVARARRVFAERRTQSPYLIPSGLLPFFLSNLHLPPLLVVLSSPPRLTSLAPSHDAVLREHPPEQLLKLWLHAFTRHGSSSVRPSPPRNSLTNDNPQAVVFLVIFGISTVWHTYQSFARKSPRFMILMAVAGGGKPSHCLSLEEFRLSFHLACAVELIGWGGRVWSRYDGTGSGYIMQASLLPSPLQRSVANPDTLDLLLGHVRLALPGVHPNSWLTWRRVSSAPTFMSAALYVLLGVIVSLDFRHLLLYPGTDIFFLLDQLGCPGQERDLGENVRWFRQRPPLVPFTS